MIQLAATENPISMRIATIPRKAGFYMEGYRVWGSTVVLGEDNRYHMFATRVPEGIPFHPGWMIASEIVRASSDTPKGPFKFEEVVLPARGAQYWDGRSTHNPRMLKVGDTYVLYYMGSTHPFEDVTSENSDELTMQSKWTILGRSHKRVGIAVSKSVFGPWERYDKPVLPTKPNTFYSFLTSNPSACIGPDDGKIYLMFKARKYNEHDYAKTISNEMHMHSDMMIGMAVADSFAGPYKVISKKPLFSKDTFGEIEDPFMWSDKDGFHMLAKDQRGTITGTHGNGILAHSQDALNWKLADPPMAYSRNITWDDGTEELLGNMERCSGLLDKNGRLSHLYFAIWQGGGFCNETADAKVWNISVPLI